MESFAIRGAALDDVVAVVDVHMASFPEFFLTTLGRRFLREFYGALISEPTGVLQVATSNESIIGFVGGASEQVGFYRSLVKGRKWRFGWAALPAIARRPSIAGRVLRGRQRASDAGTPPGACLMSIGVRPEVEGGGIGRALVGSFEREVGLLGAMEYRLTTDADENDRTNDFYRSLGLNCRRTVVTPEGRQLNEYVKSLAPNVEGT